MRRRKLKKVKLKVNDKVVDEEIHKDEESVLVGC